MTPWTGMASTGEKLGKKRGTSIFISFFQVDILTEIIAIPNVLQYFRIKRK